MAEFDYGAKRPDGQYERHPTLPAAERAQGFVRPVRRSYQHVGPIPPRGPLRELTAAELTRYASMQYVAFEEYPDAAQTGRVGRYWTRADLDRVGRCGAQTTMPIDIAETYARRPEYYGQTFCASCGEYFRVGEYGEFVWPDGSRVGT